MRIKYLLVAVLLIFHLPSEGQNHPAQISKETILSGSATSIDDLIKLHKKLMSIPSNDPKVNANQLNRILIEHNLPTIDVANKNFKLYPTTLNMTGMSSVIGVSIEDGKNVFCLPCSEPGGWNSFVWGIIPKEKMESYLFDKNKRELKKLFGQCEKSFLETQITEGKNGSGEEVKTCQITVNCVNGEFSEASEISGSCVIKNNVCPADPIDCLATGSTKIISRGDETIDQGNPIRELNRSSKNKKGESN